MYNIIVFRHEVFFLLDSDIFIFHSIEKMFICYVGFISSIIETINLVLSVILAIYTLVLQR